MTIWSLTTRSERGKTTRIKWKQLVAHYETSGARIKPKSELKAPVFATVRPECTPDTCDTCKHDGRTRLAHRCDQAVTAIHALTFDHDHEDGVPDVGWDAIESMARFYGIACILYESPSHMVPHAGDGTIGMRWRVVFPLAEPWADLPEGWKSAYSRLRLFIEAQTGIAFDDSTCNASRIFYPPTRPTEDTPARRVLFIPGNAIDLPATLALLPKPEPLKVYRPSTKANASSINELDDEDRVSFERWAQGAFESARREVSSSGKGSRNNTLNYQTFALVSKFVPTGILCEQIIERVMLEAAKQAGLPDREAQATIINATKGAKANAVPVQDIIAKWRATRREHHRITLSPPDDDHDLSEGFNPEGVCETDCTPPDEPEFHEDDWQRVSDVVGTAAPERLVMPKRFKFVRAEGSAGNRGEYSLMVAYRQSPKTKNCPQCQEVCQAKARLCSAGHTLPDATSEEVVLFKLAYTPIWIGAELIRPPEEGNLLRLDALVDGKRRSVVVERAWLHDARKLAQHVDGFGVGISTSKGSAFSFAEYLQEFQHVNRLWLPRKRAHETTGWTNAQRTRFLLGREPIGSSCDTLYVSHQDPRAEAIGIAGDPIQWRNKASEFISESPAAALALAASIASPLLRVFSWQPVGIMLPGLGGGGKTAIERLAGSAFGSTGEASSRQAGGIVGNGNSTLLGLPGQFMTLQDLPHIADEVTVCANDAKARLAIATALHQLIDGEERIRLQRDGNVRPTRSSRGCVIVATEIDPSEFLRLGGVVRRFLVVRGPYSPDPEHKPLGRHVPVLSTNYGHAGRALIVELAQSSDEQRRTFSAYKGEHADVLRTQLTERQRGSETIRTWLDQIATSIAALRIACELCPTSFPSRFTWESKVLECWNQIRNCDDSADESEDPVRKAYDVALTWLSSHRQNLQPSVARERQIAAPELEYKHNDLDRRRKEWIGRIIQAVDEDQSDEELQVVDIMASLLTKALAAENYSTRTMTKSWADRGWLVRGKSGETCVVSKIGGVSARVYRLSVITN